MSLQQPGAQDLRGEGWNLWVRMDPNSMSGLQKPEGGWEEQQPVGPSLI